MTTRAEKEYFCLSFDVLLLIDSSERRPEVIIVDSKEYLMYDSEERADAVVVSSYA